MPVIPGLLSFRSISISLQRWTKWCRHQQCQPLRGDMSMVAFDMPPARGVPGTLVEPSLNPQKRTETYPNTAHSTRLLNPQFFHFSPFLVTWLSANRYIFPSQCLIHPLSFHNAAIAFFTSQVTEAAITLQTLDCHCWQNEAEGAGGERRFYSVITKANE